MQHVILVDHSWLQVDLDLILNSGFEQLELSSLLLAVYLQNFLALLRVSLHGLNPCVVLLLLALAFADQTAFHSKLHSSHQQVLIFLVAKYDLVVHHRPFDSQLSALLLQRSIDLLIVLPSSCKRSEVGVKLVV